MIGGNIYINSNSEKRLSQGKRIMP